MKITNFLNQLVISPHGPVKHDDFSTQTLSADGKDNSFTPPEFESDDETGPEEQEVPPNIHVPGSSSQEGLEESQNMSLDVHLLSTQEDAQQSLNESTGETDSSLEPQGESIVKFSPIVLPHIYEINSPILV